MKKRYMLLAVVLVTGLVLAACGGGAAPAPSGGGQSAPGSTGGTQATKAPQQPAPIKPAPQQPAATPENSGTQLDLQDVTAGLDALNSYQSTFSMSFEGTENGQSKTGTFQSTEEYVKNPPAKRTSITGMGTVTGTSTSGENAMQMIQVNGKEYIVMGTTCIQQDATSAPQAASTFKPADIIGDVRGAQLVGSENVNNVPTKHYKTDVSGLQALGYVDAQGDVWVAESGNFVVKYTFQATGKDQFFGNTGSNGTVKWSYEISQINQPIDIQPPANCGGAASDIPIMSDATNQSAMGTLTTYTSPSKFDDVVAFYAKEMPAKGWTEQQGGLSAAGASQKSYTKDNRTVQIMITTDQSSGNTTVLITEGK